MSYKNGPKVVTEGLIAYLDAANTKSYPGSGTTWYDLTKNENHGTISSGEFVSGDFGGYLRNSGNTSNFFYITIAHSSTLNSAMDKDLRENETTDEDHDNIATSSGGRKKLIQ